MSTQPAAHPANGGTILAIAFALTGLVLIAGGGALFLSETAAAGYGIWVFVWGLAFLLGALSRNGEARA